MNLPNKLSILRIILIPVTLVFMLPISIYGFEPAGWNNFIGNYGMLIAAFIFIIASLTDMADGKIARKYNLITNLGKFLDSLADKMLIIGVLIAFVGLGRISAWLLMIIVLREFMVTGIRMLASEKGVVMAAKMIGKVKTTTQMIAVIYLMFEPTIMKIFNIPSSKINPVIIVGDVLFGICVIMTVVSGLDYLLKNLNFLKES
ncbi:MAG TPA: CDP-diacylglycerol--glycerol-3-phosphate 3-phosphatidyltransferase [Saccharofermentans sp.]|nr:CDP-diacylglycerol--glycerol-3-phosphate 3-phosphatidyltransferase [Saccharofermentans sp.]